MGYETQKNFATSRVDLHFLYMRRAAEFSHKIDNWYTKIKTIPSVHSKKISLTTITYKSLGMYYTTCEAFPVQYHPPNSYRVDYNGPVIQTKNFSFYLVARCLNSIQFELVKCGSFRTDKNID